MLARIRRNYGNLFFLLAAAHTLVAIIDYRSEWADLFRNGFFDQIDHQGETYQALGYWFFILGPFLVAIGLLAQSLLNATGTLPRAFSWIVIVTSFAAAFAMYATGMWLVGLLGILGLAFAEPAKSGHREGVVRGKANTPRPRFEV